jgi:hypothetical protein
MKKIIAFALLLFSFSVSQSQTVDDILNKVDSALGGTNLDTIKSLQITSNLSFNMMNRNISVTLNTIRDRGKFFRRQDSGMGNNSYTIVTPDEGYTFIPPMRGFGGGIAINDGGGGGFGGGGFGGPPGGGDRQPAAPLKMDDAQLANHLFELDQAGAFSSLIHYAAKGHKAELQGTAKVNKTECYKIKVTLKSGQQITYYISTATYLIVQSEAISKYTLEQVGMGPILAMMGASERDNMKTVMTYSDYKDFNGIKFPGKQKLEFGALDIQLETKEVLINKAIDNKWYTM